MTAAVIVVGIGADGWTGLTDAARERILGAEVLFGGERLLGLVPPVPGQERRCWPRPLAGLADLLAEYDDRRVVALASGDPFRSGIGTTLADLPDVVEVTETIPAVSSVALARARMRWSAESTEVVTLVGREADALRRELAPGRRVLVLSSDETTPATVARLLREQGLPATRMTVLGDLGAPTERRIDGTAQEAWAEGVPRLHVLALDLVGLADAATSWAPGLPDDCFEHDGQITKRDLRASALARLAPMPGALLWDVGAGAGSVAIEWLRAHPATAAIAVEADPERAARIIRNAARLGVPRLQVLTGRAPDALAGLATPDAVFVGGGATSPGVLDHCRERLAPGGRLVAHAVTLETEQALVTAHRRLGGDLVRISVEHVEPLGGRFRGWSPASAVVQWTWTRSAEEAR